MKRCLTHGLTGEPCDYSYLRYRGVGIQPQLFNSGRGEHSLFDIKTGEIIGTCEPMTGGMWKITSLKEDKK